MSCPCSKKGGAIATYADYSKDWTNAEDSGSRNLAVDSSVGYNEYVFGRTTPQNQFVVATGLLEDKTGLLMTGAGLKKSKKKKESVPKKKHWDESKKINWKKEKKNCFIQTEKGRQIGGETKSQKGCQIRGKAKG